jgi:hypothetical protein
LTDWDCVQGGTVLVPNLDHVKHLHIVLCDPQSASAYVNNSCILGSVTTIRPNVPHDDSCILRAGDHEFLSHDSFVYYKMAKSFTAKSILSNINSGLFAARLPLERLVFRRVLDGLVASDFVSPWVLKDFAFNV